MRYLPLYIRQFEIFCWFLALVFFPFMLWDFYLNNIGDGLNQGIGMGIVLIIANEMRWRRLKKEKDAKLNQMPPRPEEEMREKSIRDMLQSETIRRMLHISGLFLIGISITGRMMIG